MTRLPRTSSTGIACEVEPQLVGFATLFLMKVVAWPSCVTEASEPIAYSSGALAGGAAGCGVLSPLAAALPAPGIVSPDACGGFGPCGVMTKNSAMTIANGCMTAPFLAADTLCRYECRYR